MNLNNIFISSSIFLHLTCQRTFNTSMTRAFWYKPLSSIPTRARHSSNNLKQVRGSRFPSTARVFQMLQRQQCACASSYETQCSAKDPCMCVGAHVGKKVGGRSQISYGASKVGGGNILPKCTHA